MNPRSWKEMFPDCECSEENDWFCDACMRRFINGEFINGEFNVPA